MRLISSVRSGAPGNPNRKKKNFTPLLIALKYFPSLVFSQLCAAGDGCKNLRHIFIYKPILLGKNKTKQNKAKLELCYALRSMSVLIAVRAGCCLWCYLPEWTSLHFC